jgi:hypothetical protein
MVSVVQGTYTQQFLGRIEVVVGSKQRQVGVVALVGDRGGKGEAGALAGSVRTRASNDGACLAPGSTELFNTRSDPPPKHKDNYPAQAHDIAQQWVASAGARESVSALSNESGSASACETASKSTAVGVSAFELARRLRAREPRGRDAARDVGRTAGRTGDAERWLAQLAPATLPAGVARTVNDSHSKWYRLQRDQALTVVLEIDLWQGELWAHLAITGRGAPPTLADLVYCRDLFLGDRKAIQVLPRKIEAAEAGARSVHLYVQLESDSLPSCSRTCHPSLREQA